MFSRIGKKYCGTRACRFQCSAEARFGFKGSVLSNGRDTVTECKSLLNNEDKNTDDVKL